MTKGYRPDHISIAETLAGAAASDRPFRFLANNLALAAAGALDEANTLTVEEVTINLKRLPAQLDGFHIVHLSDIHHSPFTNLDHIKRTIDAANALEPDMFVLTGDYVSHDSEYIGPMAEEMGRLVSEYGTYACLGNHDHWTDPVLVTSSLRAAGVNVLINEGFRFFARGSSFWMSGVDDLMVGKTDLRAALAGSSLGEMKLLLAHNPGILRRAARAGVDLMLSGHTHGGQIRLRPVQEGLIMPRNRRISGLHRRKDTQIYVTRGIGTVVVPVRFQCPPEISSIRLVRA